MKTKQIKKKWRIVEYDSPITGKYYKVQKRIIFNIWWNMEISQESTIVFNYEDAVKWFNFFTKGYTKKIIHEA